MTNKNITENFKYSELVCPCCSRLKITERLYKHMELLQQMRDTLGFSIIINSGYRCESHNKNVGGSLNSQHMKSFATDVRPSYGNGFKQRLRKMYELAESLGFVGIGEYESFIHLDLRKGKKARWNG